MYNFGQWNFISSSCVVIYKEKKKTVMRTEEITYYQNMYEKIYTQKK